VLPPVWRIVCAVNMCSEACTFTGLVCTRHAQEEPTSARQRSGTSSTRGLLNRYTTSGGSEDLLSAAYGGPASIGAHPTDTLLLKGLQNRNPTDEVSATRCRHQAGMNTRIGSETCRMRRSRMVFQRKRSGPPKENATSSTLLSPPEGGREDPAMRPRSGSRRNSSKVESALPEPRANHGTGNSVLSGSPDDSRKNLPAMNPVLCRSEESSRWSDPEG
jgi:hypothetical protein